jgi:integrase
VEALTKRFLDDYAAAHNKPSTVAEYERLIRLHITPKLGKLAVNDVTRDDVREWHAGFRKNRVAGNRALALLKTLFNQAEEWGLRKLANPARKVKMFPERGRERFLTSEEIGRLGDTLRISETTGLPWSVDTDAPKAKHTPKEKRATVIDPHAAAAIRLLLLTGARLREILHARWDWIDWERSLLILPDSKTGKKPIYLPAPALAVLESLPRMAGNPHIIAGHGPRKKKGEKLETKKPTEGRPRADLKKPWAAVAKHAGLEGVRLHDLRHSFASIGAGASLGLPIIGKLLGHTQPATTARYSHLDADPLHRAANLIGGHIAAALQGRKGDLVEMRAARPQAR